MESSSDVLGDPDLVAKKNIVSYRPAGSGDLGNRNPWDLILLEIDSPCADDVGKSNLSDFSTTGLITKVSEVIIEDESSSNQDLGNLKSNLNSGLFGSRDLDLLKAHQVLGTSSRRLTSATFILARLPNPMDK
jgi:hypothetical protein